MAISKKQKKRLKDSANLLRNAKIMAAEMEEISQEYATEIKSIIEKVKINQSRPGSQKKTSLMEKKRIRPFRSKSVRKALPAPKQISDTKSESKQNFNEKLEAQFKDPRNVPAWAKDLWRKIMFNCHPDRLNPEDFSAIDLQHRTKILEAAMLANEQENWPELLPLAILVEQYTDKLSHNKQMKHLSDLYSVQTSRISAIQQSYIWVWGANWDVPDVRVKILEKIFEAENIRSISKEEIIKIVFEINAE